MKLETCADTGARSPDSFFREKPQESALEFRNFRKKNVVFFVNAAIRGISRRNDPEKMRLRCNKEQQSSLAKTDMRARAQKSEIV